MAFENAKIIGLGTKVVPGKKKNNPSVVIAGAEQFAHLDLVVKTAVDFMAGLKASMTEKAIEHFMRKIKSSKKKPDNIFAIEGYASVGVQLQKRSTATPLSEEERKILKANKIKFKREVLTPRFFGINPAYCEDEELLAKVEAAVADIVPDDFFVIREEQEKFIIDEDCLDAIFKNGSKELITLATTIAFRPGLHEVRNDDITNTIITVLLAAEEKAKATPPKVNSGGKPKMIKAIPKANRSE